MLYSVLTLTSARGVGGGAEIADMVKLTRNIQKNIYILVLENKGWPEVRPSSTRFSNVSLVSSQWNYWNQQHYSSSGKLKGMLLMARTLIKMSVIVRGFYPKPYGVKNTEMLSAQCDCQTNLNKQMQLQETFLNSHFVPDLSKQCECSEMSHREFSVKVCF